MRQKYEFKSIVAETLLIPLYMRAKESRRDNPILYDKAAERLADSLEYDYSQFDGAKLSEVGCVVRGWYFDRAVRRFIEAHSCPVVVNVGCGLDTRFQRIGDGKAVCQQRGVDVPIQRTARVPGRRDVRWRWYSDRLKRPVLPIGGGDFKCGSSRRGSLAILARIGRAGGNPLFEIGDHFGR